MSYSDMTYAWFDVTRNAVTVSDYLHVTWCTIHVPSSNAVTSRFLATTFGNAVTSRFYSTTPKHKTYTRQKADWCARIVQQCVHPPYPPLSNIKFHYYTLHTSAPHELNTHLWPRPVWLLCTVDVSKPGATCTGDGARTPVIRYPPAIYNVQSLYKCNWKRRGSNLARDTVYMKGAQDAIRRVVSCGLQPNL